MSGETLFVIFGASGDLTRRKLIPALYHLVTGDRGHDCYVLGVGAKDLGSDGFRKLITAALLDAGYDAEDVTRWCDDCVGYQQVERDARYDELAQRIREIEASRRGTGNRVFYMALPPAAFQPTVDKLGAAGLHTGAGEMRLVVEKPFGHDLASAQQLNDVIHRYFPEEAVYRIDHYLGKETVQNLLVFRFANAIFESSWNRDRVARVEITVAEDGTVGGRGGYYDAVGVVRDMVQNHLTQLFTLVAMEPPAVFTPTAIRNEKVKVLRALRPLEPERVVLGQYGTGSVAGAPVAGYVDEPDVASDSATPTFAALQLDIQNWRWDGVPFLLRTGKALARRVTEIAVVFHPAPVQFFDTGPDDTRPDVVLLTLQPDEGFEVRIDVKRPRERLALEEIALSFDYADAFGSPPEAYETLLADILDGDQTLFVRSDEVEESWRFYEGILDGVDGVRPYPAGTWGPEEAARLVPGNGRWTTT